MSQGGAIRTARALLGALGVGLGLWGLWLLLSSQSTPALVRLPLWLGGAVLVDDFFLIPITVAVGWTLTRWSIGPGSVGPRPVAPRSDGPRSVAPPSAGPRSVGFRSVGPWSVGPWSVGPWSVGPWSVGFWSVGRWSVGGNRQHVVGVVRTILLYVGVTTVVALPLLLREGDSGNPTVLPRNYLRDWLLLETCIVLAGVVWLLITAARPTAGRSGEPTGPSASEPE